MGYKRRRSRIDQQGWAVKKRRTQARRNWVDMPTNIMLLIFLKLGVVDILENAQNVCSYWRKLAKEPILYRVIDFQGAESYMPNNRNSYNSKTKQFFKLAKEAVDRSCGQLVKLSSIGGFGWDLILRYVNCTNSLKSLQLRKGIRLSGNQIADIVGELGSVEELDICSDHFAIKMIEQVGRTCQKLTRFRLSISMFCGKNSDEELSIMVRNLPQVRRLSLAGFLITTEGLQTILDGFPLLQHLNLEQCSRDKVLHKENILKRCATKISSVIPPVDCVSRDRHWAIRGLYA